MVVCGSHSRVCSGPLRNVRILSAHAQLSTASFLLARRTAPNLTQPGDAMRRGFVNLVYAIACALLAASAQPHASAPDIVLYASDAVNLRGNWSRAADATAAGGQTLARVDPGAS